MNPFSHFRVYHWMLALLFGAAYLTGEGAGLWHVWLGYALIVLLLGRFIPILAKTRGFPALLPTRAHWKSPLSALSGKMVTLGLITGVAATLIIGVCMIDNQAALAEGFASIVPEARADDGSDMAGSASAQTGILSHAEEMHEWLANAALVLVGMHVGWLLLFRRRQAWAMLGVKPEASLRSGPAATLARSSAVLSSALLVRVASLQRETSEALSIVFDLPPEQQARFAFLPGQFLSVEVPTPQATVWRCYSLSAAPHQAILRITVKRVAGGLASNWLNTQLKVGDWLRIMPPAGGFVPATLEQDLLLIAAGSGITPLYAILRAALDSGRANLRLIYVNRSETDVIFAKGLTQLLRDYPQRLSIHWHYDDRDGRLDTQALIRLTQDWHQVEAFICGPAPFMAALQGVLLAQGALATRVHLEQFSQSNATQEQKAQARAKVASQVQVEMDGRLHQMSAYAGETLLEAMERGGVHPPSACRNGVCGSCKCKVTHGTVELHHNQVLSTAELAAGWTLPCQAEAKSDALGLRF